MNIKVYAIGAVKDKNKLAAIKEYEKRLTRYCKFEIISCKNSDILLKKLNKKHHVVKVSTNGQLISSEELADKINALGVTGTSDISFVYSEDEIEYIENLSISRMDLSLGMMMTVITEQIYRAYRIMNNQAYHK